MNARPILGESRAIKEMIQLIHRVSATKTNILVIGESGTGKELVARLIHDHGPLKGKPFVPVNCGAIPENLIESEMFGHRKGSFTGAIAEKPGLFEAANGGTLFLDEVGELPLGMQVKLLRAIQERCFRKVGGTEDIRVDVRIIAATNRDLETAAAKGTFREDLYYRLNVIQIRTPPLRERPGDVRQLAESFLKRMAEKHKRGAVSFEPEAFAALEAYRWPGNVRELENTVERALTLASGNRIGVDSLPDNVAGSVPSKPEARPSEADHSWNIPPPDFASGPIQLESILNDIERTYLHGALQQTKGVRKKAAELLGITFRSMRYRLKKLGMADSGDDADD